MIGSQKHLFSTKFFRTEDDRITLERKAGNECRINIGNAQTNDSGLWVFTIGTMEGETYKEIESKDIVHVVKSKS